MNKPAIIFAKYANPSASASSTRLGLDSDFVLYPTEDLYWSPDSIITDQSVTIDLGAVDISTGIYLAGEGLTGVVLTVQASNDNFAAETVEVVAAAAGGTDGVIYRIFGDPQAYRYWRIILSGLSSKTKLCHVAVGTALTLPFWVSDPDLDSLVVDAEHLTSQNGSLLSTIILKKQRLLHMDWGLVDPSEYVLFQVIANTILSNQLPFVLVPDIDEDLGLFGIFEPKTKFSGKYDDGCRRVGALNFIARVI